MNIDTFLARVLPQQGLYVLAVFPKSGKPIPRHIVFTSIAELAAKATELDNQGRTVFHACASYKERKIWDANAKVKGGGRGKWRTRVAVNAAFTRSQWLDIDVGPGKDYATRKEALAALAKMCDTLKLPAPMIVSSGRGLHCYWTFTEDVWAEDAKPLMDSFSAALAEIDFKHDRTRTCDVASVLRPAGTHHRKGEPLLVKVVRDGAEVDPTAFYAPFADKVPSAIPGEAVAIPGMQDDAWGSGVEYPPSSAKIIVQKCAALNEFARVKGAVPEPYWRAAMGVLKYTTEKDDIIHRWSTGDPRYDKDETQDKIDMWEKPPSSCKLFEREGANCDQCAYRGEITSPITLGYSEDDEPVKKEVPKSESPDPVITSDLNHYARIDDTDQLPFWPKGYSWDGERLHKFVRGVGKKPGEWVPICKTLYYPFLRYETEEKTRAVKMCALVDSTKNSWRVFDIETTKIAEAQSLAYALGAHEVLYMPTSKAHNRQYVEDVLHGLRDAGLETTTYNSFGWHGDGIVLGDQLILKKGKQPVFLGSKIPDDLHNGFGQSGTSSEWVSLINQIYNREGAEPFQFAICAGFAAPLVKLAMSDMWHGVPIGLTGGSGIGKSTTSKVACSMYGDPRKFTVQANDEGTTLKALIARVATMRNLPLVLDEITGRETQELQSMLFALSNGKPKLRLRATGEEINPGQSWDTITFITGNLSITRMLAASDIVKADATQVRCFEIALDEDYANRVFGDINAKDLIEHQLLSKQFGVVGYDYLRMVTKNQKRVTKMLQQERSKFSAKSKEESRERFYYDLIATVMVGAGLAKKMGLIDFDLARLKKWAMAHVLTLRVSRKQSTDTPEDYLQSFLSHIHQHTLITRYFRDGRQKVEDERIVEPLREPLARNAVEDRKFIVTLKAFHDWCIPRKVDPSWLLDRLDALGLVHGEPTRQRICKGTKISGTQARCVELNYDQLDGTMLQLPDGISVVPPLQEQTQ